MITNEKLRISDTLVLDTKPLTGIKVLMLDKQVLSMLTPLFRALSLDQFSNSKALGVKNFFDAELDLAALIKLDKVADAILEALSAMDAKKYEKFICDIFSKTKIVRVNPEDEEDIQDAYEVTSQTLHSAAFDLSPADFYKALMELMKYNRFTPFQVLEKLHG